MKISQSAFDLIVAEEVSSQAYYTRHYEHPEWPGVASGVTVGIGYDLGQASRAKITADWSGKVSPDMLLVMASCSGITGSAARGKCAEVKSKIVVPWAIALDVFANRDIPAWTAMVLKACPGSDKMTPTCLGVIVSIAYNRGAGGFNSSSERNSEMHEIHDAISAGRFTSIPALIRAMKRLWPGVSGLQNRREHEAVLFQRGLTTIEPDAKEIAKPTPAEPSPEVPLNAGPARTKPPATSKTQNGTMGTVIVGGAGGAIVAHHAGLISPEVAIFIGFLAVLGGVTAWLMWYRSRNPK